MLLNLINAPSYLPKPKTPGKAQHKASKTPKSLGCHKYPSSSLFDYQEANNYGAVKDFDAEGKCEARVFSLWLNSLGVKPAIFNLSENLRGGPTHYFQALDKILPGFAVWRCVSQKRSTNHAPDDV